MKSMSFPKNGMSSIFANVLFTNVLKRIKMKKQVERIEQLEKELAELKADLLKQPEKWQDKLVQPSRDYYYYVTSIPNEGLMVAKSRGSRGRKPEHAFATAKQAELIKEKMLLMQEMYAFAHVKNEGWKPDWNNDEQIKWGLYVYKNVPVIEPYWNTNDYVFGIAVKSEEIAIEMFKIFEERIKKYYNEQY